MRCKDRYIFSGEILNIEFDRVVAHADPVLDPGSTSAAWRAPGFVDLQVNGFAGVDYNSPNARLESIAASMNAIFSTGVTRFFPTVITASPETMLGALANLARAKEALPHGDALSSTLHVKV